VFIDRVDRPSRPILAWPPTCRPHFPGDPVVPTHFDAFEARQLLAFTGNFTDTDGDTYAITLTGPGDVVVVTQDLQ
jgi:hypothetical protein